VNLSRIIALAKKVSEASDHHSHKLGAVLFKGKNVISAKSNHLFKTHPVFTRIDALKTLHAEASAILSARHKTDLKNATLLIYRAYKDGTLALAKPCPACAKLIKMYGIDTVIYSTPEGWIKEKV
jgi:deoxycytidylate deaminase